MTASPTLLSRKHILRRVPHGRKALLLTSARLLPGESVSASLHFSGKETFFSGHYPAHPLLPAHILLELFGQASAILVSSLPELAAGVAVLAGVERLRILSPIRPPSTLTLTVELERQMFTTVRIRCSAQSDSGCVARALLSVSNLGQANG